MDQQRAGRRGGRTTADGGWMMDGEDVGGGGGVRGEILTVFAKRALLQ